MNRSHSRTAAFLATALLVLLALAACVQGETGVPGPSVVARGPASGATMVPTNTVITATFSTAMNASTIHEASFGVIGPDATPIAGTVTYDAASRVATFTPGGQLAVSTTYTATLTVDVEDAQGNPLSSAVVWSFTTDSELAVPDVTPPEIVTTQPAADAVGVPTNTQITATFSEMLDPATVNADAFTLVGPGDSAVDGAVSWDGATRSIAFVPSAALAPGAAYTATVSTSVQDLAGNALAATYSWTFATGSGSDTTAPTVIAQTPTPGATGVSVLGAVSVAFDEPIDVATLGPATFFVRGDSLVTVSGSFDYDPVGMVATFTPTAALAFDTTYTASVTTGVTDVAGNPLAATVSWTFTTEANPDTTPPTIVSVDPSASEAEVLVYTAVDVVFSEAMDRNTLTTSTLQLTGPGSTPVSGSVQYASPTRTATFTPTTRLDADTIYTATVTTGARDLAGNGLAASETWTFTTERDPDLTPPTVVSTTPGDGATGVDVPVGAPVDISAAFSEPMDPSTLTSSSFRVRGPGGTSVPGTVSYDSGTDTATFTPSVKLAFDTMYTATVTTAAKDDGLNPLAAEEVWTFTTRAAKPISLSVTSDVATTLVQGMQYSGDITVRLVDPDELVEQGVFFINFVDTVGNQSAQGVFSAGGSSYTGEAFGVLLTGDQMRAGRTASATFTLLEDAVVGDYNFAFSAYEGAETDPNQVAFEDRVAITFIGVDVVAP